MKTIRCKDAYNNWVDMPTEALSCIVGFCPIVIYDVNIDAFRQATQQDVDLLQIGTQSYGRLISAALAIHKEDRLQVEKLLKKDSPNGEGLDQGGGWQARSTP
jgi:hypothetical protein